MRHQRLWPHAGQRIQREKRRPGHQTEPVMSRVKTPTSDSLDRDLQPEHSIMTVPGRRVGAENRAVRPLPRE